MKRFSLVVLALSGFIHLAFAQNILRGKITDEDGIPIAGVSVVEKGTLRGTSSNNEGFYQLNYSNPSSVVIFRFLSFTTQEIAIKQQTRTGRGYEIRRYYAGRFNHCGQPEPEPLSNLHSGAD